MSNDYFLLLMSEFNDYPLIFSSALMIYLINDALAAGIRLGRISLKFCPDGIFPDCMIFPDYLLSPDPNGLVVSNGF